MKETGSDPGGIGIEIGLESRRIQDRNRIRIQRIHMKETGSGSGWKRDRSRIMTEMDSEQKQNQDQDKTGIEIESESRSIWDRNSIRIGKDPGQKHDRGRDGTRIETGSGLRQNCDKDKTSKGVKILFVRDRKSLVPCIYGFEVLTKGNYRNDNIKIPKQRRLKKGRSLSIFHNIQGQYIIGNHKTSFSRMSGVQY